jgi:hypothetical protein
MLLALGLSLATLNQPIPVRAGESAPPSTGLRVVESSADMLVIDLDVPAYDLRAVTVDHDQFEQIVVGGATSLGSPGKPELPKFSALLGIPPEGRVSVRVLEDSAETLLGQHRIWPAAEPVPPADELHPGTTRRRLDAAAYTSVGFYPAEVARVADIAWLRDQRLARIELYPFQYLAATETLRWHRHVRIEIKFEGAGTADRLEAAPLAAGPFEQMLRDSLLNYDKSRQWRSNVAVPQIAASSTITLPQYKIVVDRDGLYRVTYTDLLSAGLVMTAFDPRQLHLTNQGLDVAIEVAGESDGQFDSGDYLLFYGQKLRGDLLASKHITEADDWLNFNGWQPQFNAKIVEMYTDDNVYWLGVGDAPGLRMAAVDGMPAGAPLADYYLATAHAEQSNRRSTLTFSGEDTWFWESLPVAYITATYVYTTSLTAIATVPISAVVRAEIAPYTYVVPPNLSAHVQFRLNQPGLLVSDTLLTQPTRIKLAELVAPTALREGQNTLTLTIPSSNVELFFDWFEIQYARRFEADRNQLAFSDSRTGARQYAASNFTTSTLHVLDVSNPWQPQRVLSSSLTADGAAYTATFEISTSVPVTYLLSGADQMQVPKQITRYAPPDLGSSNGADYLIISHRDFITSMQPLADHRVAEGLRVKIIDIDDLYNQFTDGLHHPIAIKNFLKYAYANWQPPAPTYALLVGDGHWNPKNFNPGRYGTYPYFMPPNESWVDPYQGEVDSANELVEIVGNDRLPDMLVGRLPVNTAAEADIVVSKIISYEEQAKSLPYRRRMLFVADNTPDSAGNFPLVSDDLINSTLPSNYAPDRVYADNLNCRPGSGSCPQVNYAITSTLNQTGALFVNYIGHAAINLWGGESFLTTANTATLTNIERLPIILSMTCLDGTWARAGITGLMETMLRSSSGGAVAAFSPTGLGVSTGHDQLERGLLNAIFQQGVARLGQATLAGKVALYAAGHDYDLIDTFTILGDPALRLPTYAVEVAPSSSVKFGSPNMTLVHTVYLTNSGWLTNTPTVSVVGNNWPLTITQSSTLLPGQSKALLVSVTIPLTAPLGATDVATLTFSSGDDSVRSVVGLATINGLYGATAKSDPVSQQANPDAVVTYTIHITNAGMLTDTFDLSVITQTWPVQLSTASLINLPPNSQTAFEVWTTVPLDQVAYTAEVARVVIASQGGLGFLNTTLPLTTTINPVYGFVLAPVHSSRIGLSGQTVLYTLTLTNTGNATNTFGTLLQSGSWPATISPTVGTIIPWSSLSIPVRVSIPNGVRQNALNTTVVTLTMSLGATGNQTATLVTTANPFQVLLPLVQKN